MNIVNSNFTIAELCDQFSSKVLRINRQYQRSDEVWPEAARSFLIETVILGFPVPKLTLRQTTDVKKLKTYKEIVDGQQRTKAFVDFFRGALKLTNNIETEELRGSTINEIPEGMREQFVSYSIGADILVGASDEEVREVFRRINSYTVPLNPEEQRHAIYQGAFKWFIYDLSRACEKIFVTLGTFGEKEFVRMQDAKLLTEICHALNFGITTTSKKNLDSIYKGWDEEFASRDKYFKRITKALRYLAGIENLANSALAKPHNMYALMLATTHAQAPVETLAVSLNQDPAKFLPDENIEENFAQLANALDAEEGAPARFQSFKDANSGKTNVKSQRETRFKWFYKALTRGIK